MPTNQPRPKKYADVSVDFDSTACGVCVPPYIASQLRESQALTRPVSFHWEPLPDFTELLLFLISQTHAPLLVESALRYSHTDPVLLLRNVIFNHPRLCNEISNLPLLNRI